MAELNRMKKLLTLLILLLPLCLMAQAPPVLRQSLTTNTASNPSLAGHVPIWNGISTWVPGFPATASATNITLPVILLPGSATNDAPNGKVAVAGNGITFTTNQTTNFVVSVSAELTNLINTIGGEIWWTNFTAVDFEGGTVYGIADTNALAKSVSFAVNYLTNYWGDPSALVLLGVNTDGTPYDQRQRASAIVGIGDNALSGSSLSNAAKILSLGAQSNRGVVWDGIEDCVAISEALGSSIIRNSSRIFAAGISALEGAAITNGIDIYAIGPFALDVAQITNCTSIFAIGANALGFDGSAGPIINNSSKLTSLASDSMMGSVISNSTEITAIGSRAGQRIRLTNCVGITMIGRLVGTNLIMTAKTNVTLFGNVGAITPQNEEFWFGNTDSRYLLPGISTSGGITNNGTYQHSVGAFTGALFVSSNSAGVAYWSTNVNNIGVTNLSVYNNVIFNGSIISNFNRDVNWTNDGVVLKGSLTGINPKSALRFGGVTGTHWDNTNVGRHTFGFGTNVTAIPIGAVVFGEENSIGTNANWSTIGGGVRNSIVSNQVTSFIGGGGGNQIVGLGSYKSVIGGGSNNQVNVPNSSDLGHVFIGGGGDNVARSNYVAIAGGFANQSSADHTFIGGGLNNTIAPLATKSVIAGGEENTTFGAHIFVGGGKQNKAGGNASSLATFGVIGGGANNLIGTVGAGTSIYSVINGGRSNEVRGASDYCVIGGGWANQTDQNTNTVIGGGYKNIVTSANLGQILGGVLNLVNSSGSFGYIVGNSNQVNANFAGVTGNRGSNTLAFSYDIAPNGNTTKTTFTASNLTVRTSFVTAPDTVVTLAADNQVVDATLRTHIRLASDSAVAGDRTFLLTGTNVTAGAHAILEWTGTNAGELVDDAANSGAGNIRLSATWTPTQYDTLSLIFNGTDWIETARATN